MSHIMRYSDAEIEKMLDEIESDLAERKETWKGDAPKRAGRQYVLLPMIFPTTVSRASFL